MHPLEEGLRGSILRHSWALTSGRVGSYPHSTPGEGEKESDTGVSVVDGKRLTDYSYLPPSLPTTGSSFRVIHSVSVQ